MESVLGVLSNVNTRLVILITTYAVLFLLENGMPFKKNNRTHLVSNVVLTVLAALVYFLLSGISLTLLDWGATNDFGLLRLFDLGTTETLVIAILFLDFWAAYLNHVTMHHVPAFWRFHSVHHADRMIDVSSAQRQHPLETIYRVFFQTTGALILGVPFWMLGVYLLLSATNAQLEHANISLPEKAERFLRYFYTTPSTHKVHHSKVYKESNSNYGNIFSIWDRIFGTYTFVAEPKRIEYGLDYLPDEKQNNSLRYLFAPSRARE